MQRAFIAAAIVAAVVAGGFVMVPAEPVSKELPLTAEQRATQAEARGGAYGYDYGTAKSGLRIAVEGRLKWLGL